MKKINYKYNYVLLLDDNELDNFINQKIIESVSFSKNVYVNTSSVSALEFLSNIQKVERESGSKVFPEIIFVDINMPLMDGFQFVKSLMTKIPEIHSISKIAFLTTSLNPSDKQAALEISDKVLFLNKPLTEALLLTI